MRYLITFACYGHHLHGDDSGSVRPQHNLPGSPALERDPWQVAIERSAMDQPPYVLDQPSRTAVLQAVSEVCIHRGWNLLAAHVRTNHVHIVVEGEAPPENMMTDFKSYATRRLNSVNGDAPNRKRWARHGSTRWLWNDKAVRQAIRYVVEEQGEPMSLYVAEWI